MVIRGDVFVRWSVYLTIVGSTAVASAGDGRDGPWFDPGFDMTEPAVGAPEATADAAFLLGTWSVTYERFVADSLVATGTGVSRFGLLNRGHGLVERFHCDDCGPTATRLDEISFLQFSPGPARWGLAVANSESESITLFDGPAAGEPWSFTNGRRRGGNFGFEWERVVILNEDSDTLILTHETSSDGATWALGTRRTLTRSDPAPIRDAVEFGSPTDDRPLEAAEFDFLIGDWDMAHDMTLPGGRQVQYPSRSRAVHVLGGHGVMEYNEVDVDPSLPDAATSIVRIYNRAERRWESMYATNRGNGLLHFGGNREGDRVVLHPFAADRRDATLNTWVFHDITADRYSWTGSSSTDHGDTFKPTWLIEATRRR